MADKWEIKESIVEPGDQVENTVENIAFSLVDMLAGTGPSEPLTTYTVENTETGETREVKAHDTDELGKKLSE